MVRPVLGGAQRAHCRRACGHQRRGVADAGLRHVRSNDPLTIAPKVVVLDAFSSIDGEVWELVDREDGALAETGFDLRAMSSIAAGLLALGAIALGARRRRHSTTV